jgi:predicted LPLAT superfamily acyltransferase
MLKRPVLFMTGLYRGGNRYELHFEQLFDAQAVPRHARERFIEQALLRYAERLERYCREAPYNWFNFYDFWESAALARAGGEEVNGTPAVAGADHGS